MTYEKSAKQTIFVTNFISVTSAVVNELDQKTVLVTRLNGKRCGTLHKVLSRGL